MTRSKLQEMKDEVPSLWKLGGIGPIRLTKRVWKEIEHDDIYGHAAELSYYFLLALFPALLFLVTLIGIFAGQNQELSNNLYSTLGKVLPQESSTLVQKTMGEVTGAAGTGKLTLGVLLALWAASNGISAMSKTLNIAYEVKETRPWWKTKLVSIGLTFELAIIIIVAISLLLYGGTLGEFVASKLGMGAAFAIVWKIVQWPVVLLFMLTAFASVYYFAPNLKKPTWYWISPGSVVGLTLWLAASFGLRFYLSFFNSYSKTYGSLGAVIILMLWFYLSGFALLIGGEVNSEIGHVVEEKKKQESPQAMEPRAA